MGTSRETRIEAAKRELEELDATTPEAYEADLLKAAEVKDSFRKAIAVRNAKPTTATQGGRARSRELGIDAASVPKCEGTSRSTGEQCNNPAGKGTDHWGQGNCKHHGGTQGAMTHGRYSTIQHDGLRTLVQHYLEEDNILDTLPDIALVRSLTHRFIEDYDKWRELVEAWWDDHDADNLGPPKPRKILELTDCYKLLESLSKMVERENKRKQNTAVSQINFMRILNHIGTIVTKHVHDKDTLMAIREDMLSIQMPKKFTGQ